MTQHISDDDSKMAAAQAAAAIIKDGMLVGLGTGSTARFFISSLIERYRRGLMITAVASSKESLEQAVAGGIPTKNISDVSHIDITVDGADEVDFKKRLIKGGGGALLREKILAAASSELIIIVDKSKLVKELGAFPLPVEILPFAYKTAVYQLEKLGFSGATRKTAGQKPFVTENYNYIFDIHFKQLCHDPEEINRQIQNIPGVVATGFFLGLTGRIITGFPSGRVEIIA